jgi:hypothetical protein
METDSTATGWPLPHLPQGAHGHPLAGQAGFGLANLLAQFDGTADGRHDTAPQDGEQFQ